ncbi:MAG: hypothetical protein K2X74_04890 [Acetobacteraceae bacterium]|nr:hypothetical protein [Acetobacteraceae bacterium]
MSDTATRPSGTEVAALRQEMAAQEAAIDRQVADLEALSDELLRKPGNHDDDQDGILAAIRRLNKHRLELSAAYLAAVSDALRIDSLMIELKALTAEMTAEAERMEGVTEAVKTATTLIGLGKKAMDALNKAKKG